MRKLYYRQKCAGTLYNGAVLDDIRKIIKNYGEIVDALKLVLPMAKGYAAAHPVGSNHKYIEIAEKLLGVESERNCDGCMYDVDDIALKVST